MKHLINIHNQEQTIDFGIGKYKIDVLGGWGVRLGQFSISFVNIQSGETVTCEKSFWPIQSYAFQKRAKRIFVAKIAKAGTYKVLFINPETMRVKHTGLLFTGLFQVPIVNEEILIFIHQ